MNGYRDITERGMARRKREMNEKGWKGMRKWRRKGKGNY